jgi:hypothetical protein
MPGVDDGSSEVELAYSLISRACAGGFQGSTDKMTYNRVRLAAHRGFLKECFTGPLEQENPSHK